jgi:S-formylglutathione hydrolase FrmB
MVLVYILAALVVVVHQAGGLAGWLEEVGRSGESGLHQTALNLSADLRSLAERTGLASLGRGESKILASLTPSTIVGRKSKPPAPAAPEPVRRSRLLESLAAGRPPARDKGPDSPPAGAPDSSDNQAQNQTAPEAVRAALAENPLEDVYVLDVSGDGANGPPAGRDGPNDELVISLLPAEGRGRAPRNIKKILLTGDSMMLEGIGPPLERYFKGFPDLEVTRQGRYSTGLCRLDVFDWLEYFAELLKENEPDLVVITLGANDTQDIVLADRKRHLVASDGWRETYGQRVGTLLEMAGEAGVEVLWVGLPVMGREPYNSRVAVVNEVAALACGARKNCLFWDAANSLTDDKGGYSTFITDETGAHLKVRAKDSIHLTEDGGRVMLADLLRDAPFLTTLAAPAPPAPAAGESAADGSASDNNNNSSSSSSSSSSSISSSNDAPAAATDVSEDGDRTADSPQNNDAAAGSGDPADQPPAGSPTEAAVAVTVASSSSPSLPPLASSSPASSQVLAADKPVNSLIVIDRTEGGRAGTLVARAGGTGVVPDAGPGAPEGKGAQRENYALIDTVLVSASRGQTRYLVAAPPGREPEDGLLPGILLLHGAEGDQNYFFKGLGSELTRLAAEHGVILIMPDGGQFGWYLDSPLAPESQMETYVMSEVLPDAALRFPLDPERIAVLGISMGGHGAVTLSLNNPGRFKAVSTLSAVLDLESHKSDSTLDKYLRLSDILGPADSSADNWREHSAYYLTRKNPAALAGTPVRMTVGLGDKLCLAENRQYDRLLTELGIPHEYLEESGGHGWQLWRTDFPAHLAFLAGSL